MASSDQAPWHGMKGVKRVTSEFKVRIHNPIQVVGILLYGQATCISSNPFWQMYLYLQLQSLYDLI